MSAKFTMLINEADNVAVAVDPVSKGETVLIKDREVQALNDIPSGHKIARRDIKCGEYIIKYGRIIGKAAEDIKTGTWVHCHNVEDITEWLQAEAQAKKKEYFDAHPDLKVTPYRTAPKLSRDHIMAYPRPTGEIGVRNNVVIISIIQCANLASQKISNATGAACITQEGGCLEFPDRLNNLIKGLVGPGIHPNTFGALIVGIGCQQIDAEWVAEPIRKAGKEVHIVQMHDDGGFYGVVEKGIKLVKEMQERAAAEKRVPCPINKLVLSAHCGSSDWTSGLSGNRICGAMLDIHESIGGSIIYTGGRGNQVELAGTKEVFERMMEIGTRFREDNLIRTGKGLSEVNPTPGNKLGGLSTLEEKDLGTHQANGHAKICGWLEVGEQAPHPGTWAIDQPHGNNDSFDCTGSAMAGVHFIGFPTGRGSMCGNACAPTIKITGNRATQQKLPEFIDYCGDAVLNGKQSAEEAGLELYELMLDFAEGRPTASEVLGEYSWTIPHGKSMNGDYDKDQVKYILDDRGYPCLR